MAVAGVVRQGMMTGKSFRRMAVRRILVEFGPLLIFFVGTRIAGIWVGTALFVAATTVATGASMLHERRVPILPLITLGFALVFGGLTLIQEDPTWIMVRPTLVNLFFALVLGGCQAAGYPMLPRVVGPAFQLPPAVWQAVTWWIVIFLASLAIVNEIVWRNFGLDTWIWFKVFVIPPLNIAFGYIQFRYVSRRMALGAQAPAE